MKTEQKDDKFNAVFGISLIVGGLAYGLFDINPFYFIFAVPLFAPFFDN